MKIQEKYFPALLIILFFLYSCVEVRDWEFEPGDNKQLVVESIITNENRFQEVHLSLSYDDFNGKAPVVSDAIVKVNDGQNSIAFIESTDKPGTYRSERAFSAQMGNTYELELEWNGENYNAQNEMVPLIPFPVVQFIPYGQTDSVLIGEVAPLFAPNEQAFYEVSIDWSHLNTSDSLKKAKLFFYTFRTVDVNELFRPPQEQIPFPRGSIVIIKKHALNDEFAAYYRALLMETSWQGGILDEASSSIPTNISNGGLGFFGVCAVLSDTLIAK